MDARSQARDQSDQRGASRLPERESSKWIAAEDTIAPKTASWSNSSSGRQRVQVEWKARRQKEVQAQSEGEA